MVWRSSFSTKLGGEQNTLAVHLASDGYLYIPDSETCAFLQTQLRHSSVPLGWYVLKASRREAAFEELQDFVAFATAWFGEVDNGKSVLSNAGARRIDVLFQSKKTFDGLRVALEFSFERDWPVPDESELWF